MTVTFQRDIVVELALGGFWSDISTDAFLDEGVTITQGIASGETGQVPPCTCNLLLADETGKYNPNNPMGPNFGLFDRNTPLRTMLRTAIDGFSRTVSNGLGSTETTTGLPAYPYTNTGAGGTVQASDFNVGSGVATHSIPATNAHRRSVLTGVVHRNAGVLITSIVPFTNVTGAPIEIGSPILRATATPDYYYAKATVETDESIKVGIFTHSGATIAAAVTVPGLTHSSAQPIRVFGMAEGHTLRAKVWQPNLTGEPDTWHITVHDSTLPAAGYVGFRTGVATGNTNTLPVVISCDNLEVRVPRFWGEVPDWPTQWNTARDARTRIEASGLLRRLRGPGASPPEKSTLYSAITTGANAPVAYWPCEDSSGASAFASGIGGPSMRFAGSPSLAASSSDFAGSAPLPKYGTSTGWAGSVPKHTATGQTQVRFLLGIPAGGATDGARILVFETTGGSARFWGLYYTTGGGLRVTANAATGPEIENSGPLGFAINGLFTRMSFELTQVGADVNWGLTFLTPGGSSGASGTVTGHTFGRVLNVLPGANGGIALPSDTVLGHITVQTQVDNIFTFADQMTGYAGEAAGNRVSRNCADNGIPFSYMTGLSGLNETLLGPQRPQAPISVIEEAVAANLGVLTESLGDLGLHLRLRTALYSQASTLAVDFAGASDLVPPFAPLPDDRRTVNDVTVSRTNGSSARATLTTGKLSTQKPPNGVGRYPDGGKTINVFSDSQLPDQAGFRLALGTTTGPRWPQIHLDLLGAANLTALDLMPGDRVTIDGLSSLFMFDQQSQIALGYTEHISTLGHTMDINGAPEAPYRILTLDDATLGQLDTGGSVLATDVTSGGTAWSVATTAGPLWTTDGARLPVDLLVSGERVTATAVANEVFTFVAAGTAAQADNASVTPGLPTGHTAGDLLLILAAIHNSGTGTPNTPTGYTLLADLSNARLFGKIDNGSESAPTVSFSGGAAGPTGAQMAAFRAKLYNINNLVVDKPQLLNGSAQNIAYPAAILTKPSALNNALVLYLGWKRNNWASVATLGGATEIGEFTTFLSGIGQGAVWDYLIQTSAADVAAGSFTVTGGASDISRAAVVVLRADRQAFTVSRQINNVVKAQTAGTAVELFNKDLLGL